MGIPGGGGGVRERGGEMTLVTRRGVTVRIREKLYFGIHDDNNNNIWREGKYLSSILALNPWLSRFTVLAIRRRSPQFRANRPGDYYAINTTHERII